ncbi:MAG TPA: hypothetical protein VIX42_11320 [Edaphobacter sp.]
MSRQTSASWLYVTASLIPLTLMRSLRILALLPILIVTGCHSPYVEATVSNHTTQPLLLLEVDYPSASFGTQSLAAGADFHYRFKVLGSGKMKLTYTDSARHDQKSEGPFLKEGTEGPITITVASDGIHWQPAFTSKP